METNLVSQKQVIAMPVAERPLIELKKGLQGIQRCRREIPGAQRSGHGCRGWRVRRSGWQIGEWEVHAHQHDHGH